MKFLDWIKKWRLTSRDEDHWVNHIYDESKFWPNKGGMWANVHGFDEGPGAIYWVGVDIRTFGIRTTDYVIKCKNKSTYEEYVNMPVEDMLHKMRNDSRLDYKYGDDVEVKFIFRWGDEDKSFNVRFATDSYAEER